MPPFLHHLRRFALPACVLMLGCASDPTGPLGSGLWGGTGVSLDVLPDSTAIEFDCAHGVVRGRIHLADGRFSETGDFVLEGGPVRDGEPTDLRTAVYSGKVSGGTLELTVRVEGFVRQPGPFTLSRGAAPVLRKCL